MRMGIGMSVHTGMGMGGAELWVLTTCPSVCTGMGIGVPEGIALAREAAQGSEEKGIVALDELVHVQRHRETHVVGLGMRGSSGRRLMPRLDRQNVAALVGGDAVLELEDHRRIVRVHAVS